MTQSPPTSTTPATPSVEEQPRRSLWARLMDYDIGIIPTPVYLLLVAQLVVFTVTGNLTGELAMVIGIMAAFAFTLGFIGSKIPFFKDIGGAAIMVTFVPSFLAFQGWIPTDAVGAVKDFFTSSKILNLFIAFVIVGSILSMNRKVLIRGFVKIFPPLIAGSVVALVIGTVVGSALGLGFKETLFFIVIPIMAGGVGEGAIPLTIGYAAILGAEQGELLARVLPAVLVGNLTAILLSGLLSYLGKRKPHLTGNGKLDDKAISWTTWPRSRSSTCRASPLPASPLSCCTCSASWPSICCTGRPRSSCSPWL